MPNQKGIIQHEAQRLATVAAGAATGTVLANAGGV
jgi:hypothetical protein